MQNHTPPPPCHSLLSFTYFLFFCSRFHSFTYGILISVLVFAAPIYSPPLLSSANYICFIPIANWLPARFGQWEALSERSEERKNREAGIFFPLVSLCFQVASTALAQSPSPRVSSVLPIRPYGILTYLLHQAEGRWELGTRSLPLSTWLAQDLP